MQTEREHGFVARLPFPRSHRIPAATLERDYQTVHIKPVPDARWHFEVRLPVSAQVEPIASADHSATPPATLSRILLVDYDASIDIVGLRLTADVDLASWLDEWLEQLGMTPISSRPRPTPHGVMGDILATKRTPDGITVARYATVRDHERTFVFVLRTPLANYRSVAQDFILTVSSFQEVRTVPGQKNTSSLQNPGERPD